MSRETRAVIYTPYPPSKPGAAGMRVRYLEKALQEKGFITQTLTPSDGKEIALSYTIQQNRPMLVIGTSPPLAPLFWVWLGAKIAGSYFILDAKEDGHAMSILAKTHRSIKDRAFLRLRRTLYSSADQCWFLTRSDLVEAQERYSLPSTKLKIVPNGTDPRIHFSSSERARMRKKWNVTPRDHVVVYAGTVGDEDLESYVDALAQTHSPSRVCVFVLATDSHPAQQKEKERIVEHISKKVPRSIVVENVPIDEMSAYFSGSDCGVVPWRDSLPTSVPVKLFDYAGTGLPILARGPKGGEMDVLLSSNPAWGKITHTWNEFKKELKKKIPKRSDAQRIKQGKAVSEKWDRLKIMREALSTIFFSKNDE